MGTLVLIRETKIHHLLPGHGPDSRLEASGVCAHDGHFVIVFDNVSRLARVAASLTPSDRNGWVSEQDGTPGYEDITYNGRHQRFYALIEAVPANGESYQAEVVEYDHRFRQQERHPLPCAFDRDNKGFEGLASVQRGEHDYVLALCEGNGCKGGPEGKQKGDGRIQVFQRGPHGWRHISTLKLPRAVRFTDYSSLDIRDGHVVVVSQASSQLWCGMLDPAQWDFVDTGRVWHLPRDARGSQTTATRRAWRGWRRTRS